MVTGLLVGSATVAGALAGFVLGLAALVLRVPEATAPVVAAALTLAASGDLAWRAVGRPRPLSVNRQVPQPWSRIFGLRVAAALYGGRLGVGPLTVLNTWTWWAAAFLSASLGVGPSVLAGAWFGAVRTSVMVAVSRSAARDMGASMARLRRREPAAVRATVLIAVLAGALSLLAACSGRGDEGGGGDGQAERRPTTTEEPRTTTTTGATTTTTPLDVELAAALLAEGPAGFEPIGEPGANGPLDLEAAARAEPDPQAERALLETRRFDRGHTRSWRNAATDAVVVATVYQFADEAGAAAYLADGILTLEGFGAEPFDVPSVAGARGFTLVESGGESPRVAHGVAFSAGRRFYLLVRTDEGSGSTPDDVRSLARAQADLAGV
ncbi:MAG: hypothetical protein M3R01_14040 [Actinomycetota bacterium]|nr:hypothetical protein [Actinomycetota bacterium]